MTVPAVYPSPFDFAGSPDLRSPSPGMGAIYGLFEPLLDAEPAAYLLRYIGQTRRPLKRQWDHCYLPAMRKRTHKNQWIKSLLARGLKPHMRVLAWVPVAELDGAERAYIAEGRRLNYRLTNETDGGNGVNGHIPSAAARAASSARQKGKKLSPEHCAKIAAAVRAHWQTEERRIKQHAAMAGRVMSEQARANLAALAAARKGRKASPETRAKMSLAQQGRKHTPESIARMRVVQKGKVISEVQRQRLREARLGTTLSPEHRAKIAAGLTGYKRPPMSAEQRAARALRGMGRKQSAETVQKRVEKVRATWARKRAAAPDGRPREPRGRPLRERDPQAYHAARTAATLQGHATRRQQASQAARDAAPEGVLADGPTPAATDSAHGSDAVLVQLRLPGT